MLVTKYLNPAHGFVSAFVWLGDECLRKKNLMNVYILWRNFSLGFGESHITRDLDQGDLVLNWGSGDKGEIVSADGILSAEKWKYWWGTEIAVIYRYQERILLFRAVGKL